MPLSTPVASTSAVASAASRRRISSEVKPRARWWATSSRWRLAWGRLRATRTAPPLAKPQSISSAAATRPTSSTASNTARSWRRASDKVERAA